MLYTFDLLKEYILENNCVLLRPLQTNDCGNLRHFSLNEPEIWTYSSQKAAGDEGLKKYIEFALNARGAGNEYPFIVFDKRTQSYAGSTRFLRYTIAAPDSSARIYLVW